MKTMHDNHGYAVPGFELVADAFERNFTEHEDVGVAFAAYQDGELVVDLYGGESDRDRFPVTRRMSTGERLRPRGDMPLCRVTPGADPAAARAHPSGGPGDARSEPRGRPCRPR